MLIPSIDLMGGKIVQLVQGEKKALEFDDFEEWIVRFSNYPLVQLIDLDAAIGGSDNRRLLRSFTKRLPCQVGGGIRSLDNATRVLELGAKRIILSSALVREGQIDSVVAQRFARAVGPDHLTFAVDSRGGRVAVKGWRDITSISPTDMIRALEPCCGAFLYTHIDGEGLMQGIPMEVVRRLRAATSRQLMVAGGISSYDEVGKLDKLGADAVVGMAIYTGKMKLDSRPTA
jgi:phosphoribosylformimino-5-aminoimidazole carboxamide ribotide isomerase